MTPWCSDFACVGIVGDRGLSFVRVELTVGASFEDPQSDGFFVLALTHFAPQRLTDFVTRPQLTTALFFIVAGEHVSNALDDDLAQPQRRIQTLPKLVSGKQRPLATIAHPVVVHVVDLPNRHPS
jgi:hypothetical protein